MTIPSDHDNGWRFEKRVSIGDLAKTAIVVAGVFLYMKDIETQVMINSRDLEIFQESLSKEVTDRKEGDHMLRQQLLRSEKSQASVYAEIRRSLQRIEDKLADKVDKDDRRPQTP